jgi:periplasmic protein TonB
MLILFQKLILHLKKKIEAADTPIPYSHPYLPILESAISSRATEPVAPKMELPKEDEIYSYTEESLQFAGRIEGLQKFLLSHIKYPKEALEADFQGKVYVSFIVEKDGSVSNIVVKRGIKDWISLDKEAIRVVRLLHYDRPAFQNGKPVRCEQILPIIFKLT